MSRNPFDLSTWVPPLGTKELLPDARKGLLRPTVVKNKVSNNENQRFSFKVHHTDFPTLREESGSGTSIRFLFPWGYREWNRVNISPLKLGLLCFVLLAFDGGKTGPFFGRYCPFTKRLREIPLLDKPCLNPLQVSPLKPSFVHSFGNTNLLYSCDLVSNIFFWSLFLLIVAGRTAVSNFF